MAIINEVMQESMKQIAGFYIEKMRKEGIDPTQDQIAEAIAANWLTISEQIASVYGSAMEELEAI